MTENITVQILEPSINTLEIETQVGSEPINVSVVSYSGTNISITHDLPVAAGSGINNDQIADLLVAGTGINLTYNSNIPSIIISTSGNITLEPEQVQDIVGSIIVGSGYVNTNYNDLLNSLIISVSGLQPSGNYSLVGHSHLTSDITDFTAGSSGILDSLLSTSISGGAGIDVSYYSNTDTLLISTTGVSLLGHQHTYSEITDFNTGVRANRISDLAAPTGNVSFNNYRLTNLATPISGADAITKNYLETLYASTSGLGIASFSSGDFSVSSGIVSIKNSGIDNNQLYYSYITLGSSTISLGSSVNKISGLILDGGTP
jgi:hypothetical protein